MADRPFSLEILLPVPELRPYDNHIMRKLSGMKGQFADEAVYDAMLRQEDVVLYEVYESQRPEAAGELSHGLSIVHPGKVGREYFMTKGHFHSVLDTAEIYYCLGGQGVMVMENLATDWAVEPLRPHKALYVPPGWAHRSVNISEGEDLVTFFAYPANAGHDYGSIEKRGFRKIIVEREGIAQIEDNPRWSPMEEP